MQARSSMFVPLFEGCVKAIWHFPPFLMGLVRRR